MSISRIQINKLNRRFSKLQNKLSTDEIAKIVKRSLIETIEVRAKRNLAMGEHNNNDSGALAASIRTDVIDMGYTTTSVVVGTDIFYAVYLEYGTGIYAENGNGRQTPWTFIIESPKLAQMVGKQVGDRLMWRGSRPHPFLRPAWAEGQEDFLNNLINLFNNKRKEMKV